ncbi:MAG: ATP-binding protein [Candidatus Ozemobacteraceae bacterium]
MTDFQGTFQKALPAARALARTMGPLVSGYRLWESGETLAVGVSGGKDSLSLCALLLAAESCGMPRCRVVAIHVPPPGNCPCAPQAERVPTLLAHMPIERLIFLPPPFSSNETPDCSLCSRQRRRLLFSFCLENGIRTLAFGHHQDDLIETYLLNLLFHGEPSGTMRPLRTYADGALRLIRPLLTTPEKKVIAFARRTNLLWKQSSSAPAASFEKFAGWHSQREVIRTFLHGLGRQREQVKRNLARLATDNFHGPFI